MEKRVQLQSLLEVILGTEYVYFQPPESFLLNYPCIMYTRNSMKTNFANDNPYNHRTRYSVMVIDSDPDSVIPSKIAALSMCMFDRHYKSNNLNHDVFNLYY